MSDSSASPVDVPRSTASRELERLERRVFWNSYLFLGIGLVYVASFGLELLGFESSEQPHEGRNWLIVVTSSLKATVYFVCFFLARRRPHARGFGLGLLFIVAWLASAIWAFADEGIHELGWFLIAFLFLSGLFAYLTSRKYDRALREQAALAIDLTI